jgi:uncharacterized protein (DUF2126 family)
MNTLRNSDGIAEAIDHHDQALRARGLEIWIGSEPTFTQRFSSEPEWTTQALGEDKLLRAHALALELHRAFPGSVVLRCIGRQYPGEDRPRWSIGLYRSRTGRNIWSGPPDPLLLDDAPCGTSDLASFVAELEHALGDAGGRVWRVSGAGESEHRLVLTWTAGGVPDPTDERLRRPSIYDGAIPSSGLQDELAREGIELLVVRTGTGSECGAITLELPAFADTATFLNTLGAIGTAARTSGLKQLVLQGFPPPVDRTVEWVTITPDPAVIEINMAPDSCARDFLERSRVVYAAAESLGLSPYRLYFNGAVADSGGGGQITLGGPTAGGSPFLREPKLLPRLIRYFNRHPSLSYLFAHDSIGGSGQSVRPDERGNDAFMELGLALDLLGRESSPEPEVIWRSLAPFMTDPTGNSHRAELNIEKLWNPFLPGRGQLGLVEFRAFRMQHSPERAASLACLLRALVGMLTRLDYASPLREWGAELHERFALPFYLERDLEQVFADLRQNDLGLSAALTDLLLRDEFRELADVEFEDCRLRLRRALEFWPLVGDASSQEQGTSRLVDSSTQRLELVLHAMPGKEHRLDRCRVWVHGIEIPFRDESVNGKPARVFGIRQRTFIPWLGLHPTLKAFPQLSLFLQQAGSGEYAELVWHDWRPGGGAYDGLPSDLEDACQRRSERLTVQRRPGPLPFAPSTAPAGSLTAWSLDLRWLMGGEARPEA